jgi:hypothetical protein
LGYLEHRNGAKRAIYRTAFFNDLREIRILLQVCGGWRSGKKKGRPLGERPAFLGSPPGCGISKPWGVWEGGFDERPGEPPADYLKLVGQPTRILKGTFLQTNAVKQFVSNERTLTNRWRSCHLQIRISSSVRCFNLLTNFFSPRYKIGAKGHTEFRATSARFLIFGENSIA